MKKIACLPLVFLLGFAACKTRQPVEDIPPPVVEQPEEPVAPPPAEETFDSASISQEVFESTKIEVQQFIESLNRAIRIKNYEAWKSALADEYFVELSSPEKLAVFNESAAMKTRKIVLKNAPDYFNHVVVPSRVDSTVDDIEFISPTRVKAITIDTHGRRLRLYDLERVGKAWKIIK